MRSLLACVLALSPVVGGEIAEAAEPTPARRTIGRVGAGVQLGGFYDLGDPGFELRGWAKGVGFSASLGRHYADPSESGFTEVSSEPGKQLTAGILLALLDSGSGRKLRIKLYGTGGVVHATQARGRWEREVPGERGRPGGTEGEAAVEGGTGTWFYGGAGLEVGFAALPGLAISSELLLGAGGDGGVAPGVRFAVRYYVW